MQKKLKKKEVYIVGTGKLTQRTKEIVDLEEIRKNEINKRIKFFRKERGFTQAEFAKRLGYSQPRIADLELGKWSPRKSFLEKICEEFDCTMLELLGSEFLVKNTKEVEIKRPIDIEAQGPKELALAVLINKIRNRDFEPDFIIAMADFVDSIPVSVVK